MLHADSLFEQPFAFRLQNRLQLCNIVDLFPFICCSTQLITRTYQTCQKLPLHLPEHSMKLTRCFTYDPLGVSKYIRDLVHFTIIHLATSHGLLILHTPHEVLTPLYLASGPKSIATM